MNEQQPKQRGDRSPEAVAEQGESLPEHRPRIWVASLADYNAGHLHGEWVDAAVPSDELLAAVQRVLSTSSEPIAEEWGIFDYDNFGNYQVGEYESLEAVASIACGIEAHGMAFAAWAGLSDTDHEDLPSEFEDVFMGHFESTDAFINSVLDDFDVERSLWNAIPAWIASHILFDRAGMARDLQAGDIHIEPASDGGVYVFRV